MSRRPLFRSRPLAAAALMVALAALAGCAGSSAPAAGPEAGRDSTLTDALNQAQGRGSARANPQLQLGLGGGEAPRRDAGATAPAEQAPAAGSGTLPAALAEAKTFLGTLPCLSGGNCPATRFTLTLSPSGEWRARSTFLGADKRELVEQGCWEITGRDPLRVVLLTQERASKASLLFLNDNLLRVQSVNDAKPPLETRLTRQMELDPISTQRPALRCR